jgi:hypothetical protein
MNSTDDIACSHTALDRAAARLMRAMADALPPQVPMYFAACGRRRGFLSISDMHQYEVGYWSHRDGAAPPQQGPALDGWRDRAAERVESMSSEPAIVSVRSLDTGMQSARMY